MQTTSNVLQASVGGSLELLALSASGALMSHLGHFSPSVGADLSNAMYKVCLPALVFASILQTVDHALSGSQAALQDVWVPLVAAVAIFLITAVVAHPLAVVLAAGKEEIVRRVIWTCIVLGNSNTMAVLVMISFCQTFPPLKQDPTCEVRSTGYASLYITVVTVFTWTIIFQYLCDAPDASISVIDEETALLNPAVGQNPPPQPNLKKSGTSLLTLLKRGLFSPPSLAVMAGMVLAALPGVPALFVNEHGALRPLLVAITQVGWVAIPVSSMIVGATLHQSLVPDPSDVDAPPPKESQRFGQSAIFLILMLRMVALPWLGRTLHRVFALKQLLPDPLLSVFVLVEWTVPTANNCIIMVAIVAERLPVLGRRLREDVSRCMFWQYALLPIFLTLNTMSALELQFPDT